jgi:dTDP-4-amino-4,6-dideoxygalactose transaminase
MCIDVKKKLEELALFGGPAAFAETLHVGRPNIGDRDRLLARINDMLDRRWLTNHGVYVAELEQRLAAYLGVRHCIAMCNGTVALEIAARALGLSGEVIVPAFTFVATAHALQWQEITPVFCDVDPQTHNLDPNRIEALITPRTTGIAAVHVWGQACDVDALTAIARRHHLRLMFDAAHAFGCSYGGRMIGNFGDAEVFSFHATKFFNTFEGGAVTTNDDALAAKIRLMHNFGFAGLDNVIYIGTNGKMSEVSAAMGLTSLESLEEFIAINRRNYQHYHQQLADVPGVRLLRYDEQEHNNFQYIVAEVDAQVAGISRDDLVRLLHAENVRARRYFFPACHRMEPYRSYFPHAGLLLPVTEELVQRVMILPTGTAVHLEEISRICQVIAFAVEHGAEISAALASSARSAA